MGYPIKQGQSSQPLMFLLIDSGDHISPKTGLSPVVTISKNGGSFSTPVGAVSEVGSGWYKVVGNATDSSSLGPLVLHATGTGADPVDEIFQVVAYDPQGVLDANVVDWAGSSVITPDTAGLPKVDAGPIYFSS